MSDFDLAAELRNVDAYDESKKRRGRQAVEAEFRRLVNAHSVAETRERETRELLSVEVRRSVAAEAEVVRLTAALNVALAPATPIPEGSEK